MARLEFRLLEHHHHLQQIVLHSYKSRRSFLDSNQLLRLEFVVVKFFWYSHMHFYFSAISQGQTIVIPKFAVT